MLHYNIQLCVNIVYMPLKNVVNYIISVRTRFCLLSEKFTILYIM